MKSKHEELKEAIIVPESHQLKAELINLIRINPSHIPAAFKLGIINAQERNIDELRQAIDNIFEQRESPNYDAINSDGNTALILATQLRQTEVVRLLLSMGASVNIQNKSKDDALIKATDPLYGPSTTEIIQLLLDNGANPNTRGFLGQTALTHTIGANDKKTIKLLLTKGVKLNYNLLYRIKDTDMCRFLLENGATIDEHQWIYAAEDSEPKLIALLLKHGAGLNDQDNKGNTALMLAAEQNNVEVVKLLLKKGADKEIKNHQGQTALQLNPALFDKIKDEINRTLILLNAINEHKQEYVTLKEALQTFYTKMDDSEHPIRQSKNQFRDKLTSLFKLGDELFSNNDLKDEQELRAAFDKFQSNVNDFIEQTNIIFKQHTVWHKYLKPILKGFVGLIVGIVASALGLLPCGALTYMLWSNYGGIRDDYTNTFFRSEPETAKLKQSKTEWHTQNFKEKLRSDSEETKGLIDKMDATFKNKPS